LSLLLMIKQLFQLILVLMMKFIRIKIVILSVGATK
jgi:hypothetical protein